MHRFRRVQVKSVYEFTHAFVNCSSSGGCRSSSERPCRRGDMRRGRQNLFLGNRDSLV